MLAKRRELGAPTFHGSVVHMRGSDRHEQVNAVEFLQDGKDRGLVRVGVGAFWFIFRGKRKLIAGAGKNSAMLRKSPSSKGGCTERRETKVFTFVLKTGRCAHGPSDWSTCA
ncbi:hypothetical protein AJ87_07455 [Rhizobium yanglingense]|nr:hypothetical protein AJ87_07455 [Rhizobium yanglingense]